VQVRALVPEGAWADNVPVRVAELEGSARALLTGERVALKPVRAAVRHRDPDAPLRRSSSRAPARRSSDTRKNERPGCARSRSTRCAAARHDHHRMGLDDAILIKDNHVRIAGA